MAERRTNIDVEELARRPIVRAFMERQLIELPDPATGYVFPAALAARAAAAFELFYEDGVTMARALMQVAEQVITTAHARPITASMLERLPTAVRSRGAAASVGAAPGATEE
ncbi:MAG: hypothetical protein HYS27_03240 [Deltaproteobacteria bacterium]|nr:hypothetical protein [Deltaproteobacteria bacterium]